MSDIPQLAAELRNASTGDIYTDADECQASVDDAIAATCVAADRLERIAAYHAELERLELTANVFDYAAIIEILEGGDAQLPTEKDR
ncbi:hypothetical protein SAMN03159338_1530 [Sphingomonas sp. NFR04]|uniref:hypothetical protein n=1 Tax=Sphingomonas sp. NFR04 TaxID=1566283 RepID=UPI0008F17378|nr:hypothetical protein [Sphingomonas sp. NFR04]SFJ48672.1 hypothetical protein SAMN03159338_1530 [Sphingomonas sp. NFR04]